MNKPYRFEKPQKQIREWPTEKARDEPAYSGRNSSYKRASHCCQPLDREAEGRQQGEHSRRLPLSLIALVILCLVMAAWVWFEILWM